MTSRRLSPLAVRLRDRTLVIVLVALLAVLTVSVIVGLVVTYRPQLDPVPVPTMSQS